MLPIACRLILVVAKDRAVNDLTCFSSCSTKPVNIISLRYFKIILVLGLVATFRSPPPAFAFFNSKDSKAIHARFDLIESKVDSLIQVLKNLNETSLRNQADIKLETTALHQALTKTYGLTEESNQLISRSLENLTALLGKKFQKIVELNQAFFEQERKNNALFQMSFLSELEKITSKISDIATIFKTSAQEEIGRDNENIIRFNQRMEEVFAQVSQLLQVYKSIAIEQTSMAESRITNFNYQINAVNSKISLLINIYKKSISAISASSKTDLAGLKKHLASVNSKIKQLTKIYKTSIKENNAALTTISKNLSKELQAINKKLSKFKKVKPSTKKSAGKK